MNTEQLKQLMLQSLEHEMGGVKVYEKALDCVANEDLREEWEKYLDQTRTHVEVLEDACSAMGWDAMEETPGRDIVRTVGVALVTSMEKALATGVPDQAEIVACEAISLAETKDHLDWELLRKCAEKLPGLHGNALELACDKVEEEEDEHLYHTKGWCRELWLKSLDLPAVLPPPEEEHDVKTAIGAARAERASQRARNRGEREMPTREAGSRKSIAKNATRKTSAKKTVKKTARKTAAKRSGARKTSNSKTTAQKKVKEAMRERKRGTLKSGKSGKRVTRKKQAIAIGLSEARKAGARVPKKKSASRRVGT